MRVPQPQPILEETSINRNMEEADEIPTKFVQEPSSHLKCPVCGGLYRNPVINIKCGHTFCQTCAYSLTHCPLDKSHCDTSQMVINRLVVGQIEDLQVYCRHGLELGKGSEWELDEDGCQEVIALGRREEHEDICVFALVSCSNSDLCGKILKKDLDKHLLNCLQFACGNYHKGCRFRGSKSDASCHSRTCVFDVSVSNQGQLSNRYVDQTAEVKQLKIENDRLNSEVIELQKSNKDMCSQMEKQNCVIQGLQQQMDKLIARVDALSSSPNVKRSSVLSGSQISLVEGAVTSSSSAYPRLSATSRAPSPGKSFEKWEMPFQFKCIGTLRGHKDIVWCMTTRRGCLYSGGADGIVKIWSLEQLAKGCTGNIQAHRSVIHCVCCWNNILITAGADKTINMWDLSTHELKTTLTDAHDNIISAMIVHDDLLITSSFSVIKVWDLKTQALQATMTGPNHWVRALALSKAKDKLYSGSHNAIHVWEVKASFEQLSPINHDCGSIYCLAVTHTYLIAGSSGTYDKNLHVYSTESHDLITSLCGHVGPVTSVVTSPSGRFFFSASQDMNIQMWSLEKLLPIQTLSRHQGSVNTLTLHGDFLLSGSEDHEVKVYRYFQIQ